MKLPILISILLLENTLTAYAYHCYSATGSRTLKCENISDVDLPIQLDNSKFAGHYDNLELRGVGLFPTQLEVMSNIPAGAVSGVTFDKLFMSINAVSIDENFLTPHQQSNITSLQIRWSTALKQFPWASVALMTNLDEFILNNSGLTSVEESIQWPPTVRNIDLGYNHNLTLVKRNAFRSASGLNLLSMWSSSSKIVFEEQSLYTTARNTSLELYFYGQNFSYPMFADDAFGNIGGGQLWNTLTMKGWEFRENTFRLMLKAKFDKGAEHLLMDNFGPINLEGCMDDCTHAWVYQDALKFGMKEYEKLIGIGGLMGSRIYCLDGGPILSGGDPKLYAHFRSCPTTPLPWPNNYCKGVSHTTDVIVDPEDCHCFVHCNHGQMAGHECCKPGLAFNPILKVCDWTYNVPNCN